MVDIAGIERSTLAAVPPLAQEEGQGWLLAFDPGTVGRCHSAVPLAHVAPSPLLLDFVEARYAAAALPPVLRVPELAAFEALRSQLRERGYHQAKPTLVQLAPVDEVLRGTPAAHAVEVTPTPGADWEKVFLGAGFDPVDGASRLAVLRRSRSCAFASVRQEGEVVAVGSAHGWCGLHGMRTAAAARRQGLAGSVIVALARQAQARGLDQLFLQVEQGNAAARALYAGLGFGTAWSYAYWQRA